MSKKRTGIYLYGIIITPVQFDFGLKGIDGGPVYVIKDGGLSAVVTDAKEDEYALSRRNALHHQEVIEQMRNRYDSILPVSFGTLAKTEQSVKTMISANRATFGKMLQKMAGKVEIGVKALWRDLDAAIRQLAEEDEHLVRIAAPDSPQRVTLEAAVKVGKLVETSLAAERERLKALVVSKLAPLADDMKELPLYGEEMVFNLVFLAPRAKARQLHKALRTLAIRMETKGILMHVTGEMTPYNFIEMPVGTPS